MKATGLIVSFVAACSLMVACDKTFTMHTEPGKAGASMSIRSAVIKAREDAKAKSAEEQIPVKVLEDPASGISLSVTTTVTPMDSGSPETRATETTAANLSSFTVDGFLGDEIMSCQGASQEDKDNRHFIDGALAEKGGDGYWHFSSQYKWRSSVGHHFWAYNGAPTDFTVSGGNFDSASFSYYNSGAEDLVVAYADQFWVDEADENGNYPLKGLTFRHALSEVSIDHSPVQFHQFSVVGVDEPCTGVPLRCSISSVQMLTSYKGECVASPDSFDWTCFVEDDDYTAIDCTNPDNTTFTLPQVPSNTVAVLSIYDNWRGITTPIFIQLPSPAGSATWQPGYKYTYRLTGTVRAPYYTNKGYIDPGFTGNTFQSFAVMNNLLSKYVKKVEITWTGLPVCKSNDTPIAIVYVPSDVTPTSTLFPMNKLSDTYAWKDDDNVGFVSSAVHQKVTTPIKGSIVSGSIDNPPGCVCHAEFIIPADMNSPINFYLLYDGDNNGNASWQIHDMDIRVTEFKSPVQVVS